MQNVLLVAYLIIVLALIGVILLQRSEGGGLGMGGNAGGLMTVRGSANLLTRSTAILAALFFAAAIGLTIMSELDRGTVRLGARNPIRQQRGSGQQRGGTAEQQRPGARQQRGGAGRQQRARPVRRRHRRPPEGDGDIPFFFLE
jgi:protein translocase SecG subunit